MFDRDALVCTMLRLIVPDRSASPPVRPALKPVRRAPRSGSGKESPLRLLADHDGRRDGEVPPQAAAPIVPETHGKSP
jgi:hypothetical protein